MAVPLVLALFFAVLPRPVDIGVRPGSGETFAATLSGPASGTRGGPFSGTVTLNDSPVELPISTQAQVSGGRLRFAVTIRYADIPRDWANRFHPEAFVYRIRGRVAGGSEFEWNARRRWDDVGVEGEQDVLRRFVRLETLELTDVSLFESSANAIVKVRNPFAFPLTVAATRYRLDAAGRVVGTGATRGMLLRARQDSTLLLPIDVDHGQLLGAVGRGILSGGSVAARLSGSLTVRLPRGDVRVPLDLSGQLSAR